MRALTYQRCTRDALQRCFAWCVELLLSVVTVDTAIHAVTSLYTQVTYINTV